MPNRRGHIRPVPAPPQPAWLTDALAGVPPGRVVAGLAAELALIGEPARVRPGLVAGAFSMAAIVDDQHLVDVAPAAFAEMAMALDLLWAKARAQ